jgi:hypothetical protein
MDGMAKRHASAKTRLQTTAQKQLKATAQKTRPPSSGAVSVLGRVHSSRALCGRQFAAEVVCDVKSRIAKVFPQVDPPNPVDALEPTAGRDGGTTDRSFGVRSA